MENKVIITVDGACDVTDEISNKYEIITSPFAINLNGKSYYADTEITKADIYKEYREHGTIAKTAAIGVGEYIDFFKKWIDKGYEVVHITIGSKLSCSFQNCLAAQIELKDKLHIVDSGSISSGLLALTFKGQELAKSGMKASEIADNLRELQKKMKGIFIVEKLDFLSAGGRCSKVKAMGANLLAIKPSIMLKDGKLQASKKYRGNWDKTVLSFVRDILNNYDVSDEIFFATHSDVSPELLEKVSNEIKSELNPKEFYITETKAVIGCHSGPNSIGFIFYEKG